MLLRYIPFKIWHNGQETDARYITLHMMNDPYILSTMGPGAPIFQHPVQVAPHITNKEAKKTEQPLLRILNHNYNSRDWVDDAMVHLCDDGLRSIISESSRRSWPAKQRLRCWKTTLLTST